MHRNQPGLLWVMVAAALFLLLSGFRPGLLPFNPGAQFSDAVTSHWLTASFLYEHPGADWRDTILGGQPLRANPLNKTGYLLNIAASVPPETALNLMILTHLGLAAAGMWLWARTMGVSAVGAGLSVLALLLSPRLIGHLGAGHLDLIYALAWWPGLMCVSACMMVNPSWLFGLTTGLYAGFVFTADIRLALFAFTTVLAQLIYIGLRQQKRLPLRGLFSAVLVFAPMAAGIVVPLILWGPYLNRGSLTPQDAGVFSLEPVHLLGLLLPPHSGNIETVTYVGISVLVLAVIGIVYARAWLWPGVMGAAVLYALGTNAFVWPLLVRFIPALLWFRVPSRAWFIVTMLMALLAGVGAEALINLTHTALPVTHRARWRLGALIGFVLSLVIGGFTIATLPLPETVGLNVMIGGAGVSLVILLLVERRLSETAARWLLFLVVALDLGLNGLQWLEWRGTNQWLEPHRALVERLWEENPARIYSPAYSLPQEAAEAADLRLFYGVDPFQLAGVSQAIQQAGGIESTAYSVIQPPLLSIEGSDLGTANRDAQPNSEILAAWDVSHIIAPYEIRNPRLERVAEVDGIYIYLNLDHQPMSMPYQWPFSAEGLPAPSEVDQLIARTRDIQLGSKLITAAWFFMLVLLALYTMRKQKPDAAQP